MGDLVRSAVGYAVAVAMIVGGFKFYKMQLKAEIDANDATMNPDEYPYGSYSLNREARGAEQLATGDVIAIYQPASKPVDHRVTRVVAVEGQKIEITPKLVKVDGKPTTLMADGQSVAEFRVPRGCVFVLSDKSIVFSSFEPGIGDSMRIGPVPFYHFMGKIK